MLTNFFKKDSTFSYVRLFFILFGCLLIVAAGFGVYVVAQIHTTEVNQQASKDFFQKYDTATLQYNNKRQHYIETYGKPTSISNDTKNKMVFDTYLSDDASKGMTLRYQMVDDNQNNAVLIGYLINGDTPIQEEAKTLLLKQSKGQKISDIQRQCGAGKVMSSNMEEHIYTVTYVTNEAVLNLKIDQKTNYVIDVEIITNKKQ